MLDILHDKEKYKEDNHVISTQQQNLSIQIKQQYDSQMITPAIRLENQLSLNQNIYVQQSSTNQKTLVDIDVNNNQNEQNNLMNGNLMINQKQNLKTFNQNITININNTCNASSTIQLKKRNLKIQHRSKSCPSLEFSNLQCFDNQLTQQIIVNESKRRYSLRQYINEKQQTEQISQNGDSKDKQQSFLRLPFQQVYQSQFNKIEENFIQKHKSQLLQKNATQSQQQNTLSPEKSSYRQMRRKSKSHGDVIEYIFPISDTSASHEQDQIYEAVSKAIINEDGVVDIGDKDLIQSMNDSQFCEMYALDEGLKSEINEDNIPNEKETSLNSQKINESQILKPESFIELNISKLNLKQNERIKTYNLSNQLDLKDPEISDIAISILQKNGKSAHEIKFLQKCIEGMPLFQKHQGLFEKQNTSHHLFSQIKHIKYSKNHVIFNFGSVFCLIPHNEFKDELISKQKKNEQMLQRLKILQSKTKQPNQDEGKTFLDIVMLAFTQKQQLNKQQKADEQQQKQKDLPKINPKMLNQQKNMSKIRKSITPLSRNSTEMLKQNVLFSSFLERKGIRINQDKSNEKVPFLARKSKDLDSLQSLKFTKTEVKKEKKEPQNQLKVPTLDNQNDVQQPNPTEQTSSHQIQIKIPSTLPQAQIQEKPEQKNQTSQENEKQINSNVQRQESLKTINENTNDMLQDETSKEYLLRKFPEFFMVKAFQPGESFGEIALMTKERRTATMVCQEQTHLMVLSKEGFDKIIGSFQQQNTRDKLDFLKSFQFLDSLPMSQLMSLLHYFKINSFSQKTVLYNEGDKVTDIYFIKSGEVQVLKKVFIEDEEYQQNQREQETSNKLYEMNLQLKNKIKTKKNIMVPIKLLGPGQFFGEDEVIEDIEKRTHKVVVTQHAEIYNISKDTKYILLNTKTQRIQERETFITQKKAENNNKMKEELQMIEKKKQTRLDFSEMSENLKYQQQNMLGNSMSEKQSPSSPYRNTIFGSKINQRKVRHQNSNSDSPCTPSLSPFSLFYPDLDELASLKPLQLDEFKMSSKKQSSIEVSTNKNSSNRSNFQGFLTSRNSPDNRELVSPIKMFTPKSVLSNKSSLINELKELNQQQSQNVNINLTDQPSMNDQNNKQSQNQQSQKITEKQSPKLLSNISLFDYKVPQLELEFKSHSQFVDMQEMTTRSKAENFTILIKNKNQMSGRSYFEKQDIQIDLFKDVKKKKKLAMSQISFTPQKKSEFASQRLNTQNSSIKDQTQQENDIQLESQKAQQLRSKSQENLQKKRNTTSSFYNSSQNNSIFQSTVRQKAVSINENTQLLNIKQISTKDGRQINKDSNLSILNHTGFSAMNINFGNNKSILYSTSQAIQQQLKKGSVVTLLNQQSSHFIAQKHITEFARDIRKKQNLNSLQSQNEQRKKARSSLSSKNAYINQIDYTGASQNQNMLSPQMPSKSQSGVYEDLVFLDQNDKQTENKHTCVNESQFEQYKQPQKKQQGQISNSKNSENKNRFKDTGLLSNSNYKNQKSLNQDQIQTIEDMSFGEQMNMRSLPDQNEDDTIFKLNSKYDQNQEKSQWSSLRKIENKVRSRAQTQGQEEFNTHSSSQNYTFGSMFNNIDPNPKDIRSSSYNKNNDSKAFKYERRSSNDQNQGESVQLSNQQNSNQNTQYSQFMASSGLVKNNQTDQQNEQFLQNISAFNQYNKLRKTQITFNDINKSMKKVFNLDKLVQNEAEKNFTTRLANLQNEQNQQQKILNQKLSEVKLRSISPEDIINPINFTNSNKSISLQPTKLRDKHNQRIIDLSNQKKRMNQNTQIAKLFEQNILNVDSTPSQKLHKKIFRLSSQKAFTDRSQINQKNSKDFQVESIQKYS